MLNLCSLVPESSFSLAPTCRVERKLDGGTQAVLFDVYNYNKQDHDEHVELDGFPEWLLEYAKLGKHAYTNGPIKVGEWLTERWIAGSYGRTLELIS